MILQFQGTKISNTP